MERREFLIGATAGAAVATSSLAAQPLTGLASVIASYAAEKSFSGTVLVARQGKPVYHEAFGLADRAFGVPCARDTVYRIASITKLFTSALILRQHERGLVDLDAVIRTYLPAYRGEGAGRVTIRQLLNHTSGIANFDAVTSYEQAVRDGIPAYQLPHSTDDLLNNFASGKLVREPGKAFEYNNADYIILGKIIEALEGVGYDEAVHRHILDPLGMKSTGLLYQHRIMPRLAATYYRDGDKPLINDLPVYMENWYAAGGMYSTATDLLAFAAALYGNRLVEPGQLRAMLTPALDEYGFGLWVADLKVGAKAHRFAQRPGSIMGANTLLLHFVEDGLTIVILGNTNQTDIDAFGFRIARAALG